MPLPRVSGDFGPNLSHADLSQNQDANMLAGVIPVAILGTITVAMRLLVRLRMKDLALALDDYLIVAALVFSWGTAIACFISIPFGNGYHLVTLTKAEFLVVWKTLFAYVMIYATAVTFTKCSIIAFYKRIFNFRWSLGLCLFLVIGYWITIIVTNFVSCTPVQFFWLQYTDPSVNGHCIDIPKFFFGNGIAAMLIDVLILCVPIPIIYGLQMPRSQKVAVCGILLLGSFVCAASICRIISLQHNTHDADATWTMAPVFIWSSVEPFVGIICACLPTFGHFFRRWWSTVRTGRGSSDPSGDLSNRPPGIATWRRKKSSNKLPKDSLFSVNEFGCVDEVQLMNDINASQSHSVKEGAAVDENNLERGDTMGNIWVKQDVDVSYGKPKGRRYG